MKIVSVLVKAVLGGLAVLVVLVGVRLWSTRPEPPPPGSESARRLHPGPFAVGSVEHTFVDDTRPTMANGRRPASPERRLEATIWFPREDASAHPLVVFSHGFMSMRVGATYMAEHLASHGYVVVSANFPLTTFFAPGGANLDDAVNQPGDVSMMIDRVLAWPAAERPFAGTIDPQRIGVFGISLGGLTSTLVAYHPRLHDPRVRAAISIAGPMALFSEKLFARRDVAFLMIAGTADAMVDYDRNAAVVPDLVPGASLLTVRGGSHAGFSHLAAGLMRIFGNPDVVGCRAVMDRVEIDLDHNPFAGLGTEKDGMKPHPDIPLPCANGVPEHAMLAGRQHMITELAVHAFFESVFAESAEERAENEIFLRETLARDFPEATFEG